MHRATSTLRPAWLGTTLSAYSGSSRHGELRHGRAFPRQTHTLALLGGEGSSQGVSLCFPPAPSFSFCFYFLVTGVGDPTLSPTLPSGAQNPTLCTNHRKKLLSSGRVLVAATQAPVRSQPRRPGCSVNLEDAAPGRWRACLHG